MFPDTAALRQPQHALLNTLRKVCDADTHGWRSTFKVWARTRGFDRDLVEEAMGHTVGNAVEQAYNQQVLVRAALLEQRRELMQAWGEYLSGK